MNKTNSVIRRWAAISLALFCFGFFVEFSNVVFGSGSAFWTQFDQQTLKSIAEMRTYWLNGAFIDVTALASLSVLSLLMVLLLIINLMAKKWIGAVHMIILFIGTLYLQGWAKSIFTRERPAIVPRLEAVTDYSYPSGHSFAAAAIYLTLAIVGGHFFRSTWQHAILFCFAGLLIALICFSRMYLGVHYPTDVISGASLGAAWALLLAAGVQKITRLK